MKPTVRHLLAALFVSPTITNLTGELRGQNVPAVLLHEVRADGSDRWVELHNHAAAAVDLSTWSLHYVSRTPGLPQNYWWAFPAGTVLAAGGYLRVHWFAPVPSAPTPGELFTGNTPYHFLFGLGGEALLGARGALALLSSQQNAQMNSPAIFEDWVSWGEHDFARENLAVQAGRWSAGRHAAAIPAGSSLARHTAIIGTVAFHDQAWFVDGTPTPMGPNVTGAVATSYGPACTLPGHHLLGLPLLRTTSTPLLGNAQFGLAIDATTGIYGEFVLVAFSAGAAPAGAPSVLPPFAGVGCHESIDLTMFLAAWVVPAQILTTHLPLSLANQPSALVGAELHAQAMVIDLLPNVYPPYQGITNALQIVLGM